MPKGKRKLKSSGPLRHKQDPSFASEEESLADNSSVISNLSDLRFDSDEDTLIEADDEVITFNDFEDKLKEAIEGTLQKSAKARLASLEVIKRSLTSKYICDFILDRKITLCDVVERSVRRGKGEEQIIGAVVGALLCTQLGSLEGSEEVFQALQPILIAMLLDATVSPAVRAQCASSLGVCCFISGMGAEVIQSTMDSLYSVFSGSLMKGNGVVPTLRPEISSLHSSALQGWSLLLTVLSPPYIMALTGTRVLFLITLVSQLVLRESIWGGTQKGSILIQSKSTGLKITTSPADNFPRFLPCAFSSLYLCECGFSELVYVKNKYTHTERERGIACAWKMA